MKSSQSSQRHLPRFAAAMAKFMAKVNVPSRIVFILAGVVSTAWFLFRVIPKPSRATYPCMRMAAPMMSGFIVYLLGLFSATMMFAKMRKNYIHAKYWTAAGFLAAGIIFALLSSTNDPVPVYANSKLLLGPNQPIGTPKGIFPGRVVWEWDTSATNEKCTNAFGDGWFQPNNTNIVVVNQMVTDAVKRIAGKNTVRESWDALFRYFNQNHAKGDVGYVDGEKIFIKTNQVSASNGTYDTATYAIKNQSRYGMAETSPQVALAVLRQLINECGVKQENISIGDPLKHMYKHVYDMWHDEFPNVTYIDYGGTHGRTKPVMAPRPSIYYSDRGAVLKDGGTTGNPVMSDYLPTVITQANYLIAIPAMKAHARGGVTLCGKIHFGSHMRSAATHLHGGLVSPDKGVIRNGTGLYRVLVDLMGHKDLGGKTVIFIVDALWAGSEANDPPRKFFTAPFNSDWTSSVFVSQDQVALESVCFDFLKEEYTSSNPYGSYPQMPGVDEHMMQAADSTYWPAGIKYDPENDGSTIGSLGVYEHWNNAIDKQYSRNLHIGNGIELVRSGQTQATAKVDDAVPSSYTLLQNYPNPFNPATTVVFSTTMSSHATLKVFSSSGSEITTLFDGAASTGQKYSRRFNAAGLASGIYIAKLEYGGRAVSQKLLFVK
ncbi:MAG: DUF362 domain-containing protein [Ignavibacteriales bacterium]|nr:DUF362 domain-containing protein [Ignavibacteriales bacterium]